MTNSFNLFPKPKIIFIHGLNNNAGALSPLMNIFKKEGYEVELVILPGHGENRGEATTFEDAGRIFEERMNRAITGPYVVIAFSQGALYLQHWLHRNVDKMPLKQVLIAPAFAIRRQKILKHIFSILPSLTLIKSLSPKAFRRYSMLTVREYNILIRGILHFEQIKKDFTVDTLILIDPRDELVDAKRLMQETKGVEFWERPYLKKGLGQHHILFHPDYFTKSEWLRFAQRIRSFLFSEAA